MPAALQTDVEYLRRQAKRCEQLARLTVHPDRRDTLLSLARVYRGWADMAAGRGANSVAA